MAYNPKAEKLFAFVRVANEGLQRYQNILEKQSASLSAAQKMAATAVKACVDHERIFEHQKEAVMSKLASSHVACLEFIRDLAAHRTSNELGSIGTPVGQTEKSANFRAVTGAQVADFDETEAGRKFRERLLGK